MWTLLLISWVSELETKVPDQGGVDPNPDPGPTLERETWLSKYNRDIIMWNNERKVRFLHDYRRNLNLDNKTMYGTDLSKNWFNND